MKIIGLIVVVLVCYVAANTNPNVVQKTEITEKHALNANHETKAVEQTHKKYDVDKKSEGVQEHHTPTNLQQHNQESRTEENHVRKSGKASEQHVKENHNEKDHLDIKHKQHKDVHKQQHKIKQNHVSEQYHGKQNDHLNPQRHHSHRHMLLKSHSVHKLSDSDVDVEGFENQIVEMLKGIEFGKIK